MKKINNKKGFTLVELLIAMSIFMVFILVVSNSFIDIIRAQKTANETRSMYSELRNLIDLVNNEMREGSVDFFCYNQDILVNPDFVAQSLARCVEGADLQISTGNNLRTISKDGLQSSVIKFVAGSPSVDGVAGVPGKVMLMRFRNNNGSWSAAPGFESGFEEFAFSNLEVKDLKFDIYPKIDPTSSEAKKNLAAQLQPMVKMNVQVGSKIETVKFDLNFQTLITARK